MKSIVLILAMVGIVLIAVGYVQGNFQCPPPKIEYRYITKTFEDDQNVDTPLMSMSGIYSMFEDDSPWIADNSYASASTHTKN